jgi:hypothetical protein
MMTNRLAIKLPYRPPAKELPATFQAATAALFRATSQITCVKASKDAKKFGN